MTLSTFNAQKKLHEILTDAGICEGRIHDAMPDAPSIGDGAGGSAFPYIVISDVLEESGDLGKNPRLLMFQTLQVFTRYRGKRQTRDIADSIRALLHNTSFQLSDGNHLRFVWSNTQVFHEPDGRTYRATMRFRLTLKGECNG